MITGAMLIGDADIMPSGATFQAIDPTSGAAFGPVFGEAAAADIATACAAADAAFDPYRALGDDRRAAFLGTIASEIEALGPRLIEIAHQETALPMARLEGESARTVAQLRMFADYIRTPQWRGERLDHAMPDRLPLPRSELRLTRIPVGPVAIFGASNFPLAFSVAGGDTASALAAGCPVVVKAHPAHPGTSELVGRAVRRAAQRSGMPAGVFSLITGQSHAVGSRLVADPPIAAVGFTGSRAGGMALVETAAARPRPIPVFAEMSSVNPQYLMPLALVARAEQIAADFVASLTLGAGQFCTNPGLIVAIAGDGFDRFAAEAADRIRASAATTMLSPGIADAFRKASARIADRPGVTPLATGGAGEGNTGNPMLVLVDATEFLVDTVLQHEMFGPAALIVRCASTAQMEACARSLEGQLTATVHCDQGDRAAVQRLFPLLERQAGRILFNGYPTGVEVASAMVHGGPFPATSDSRTTSVGTLAMERFLRPICIQNCPEWICSNSR